MHGYVSGWSASAPASSTSPRLPVGARHCGTPGVTILRGELPRILATPPDVLSPRMLRIIEDLAGDWRRLDERVEGMSNEIEAIARQDAGCERLMSVPGHLQRNGGGDRRRERAVTLPPGTELLLWVKGLNRSRGRVLRRTTRKTIARRDVLS